MKEEKHQRNMDKDDDCKLKVYSKRSKRAPVLIADFTHGEVKSYKNDLKFECFKKESSANNIGCDAARELVASNGRLNYVGLSRTSALQYFVGVRSKSTGKMKLYDCVLFRMKPELKNIIINSQPTTSKSYWEGMNELTQNFGSKAKKRALSTLQKVAVDASLDKSLVMNDSFLLTSPDTKSNVLEAHHQIDYLPPINRHAPLPSEVFDLKDIISPEEDNALNLEAQELMIGSAEELDKRKLSFCKYVSARFNNVTSIKAKHLLYYNYLVGFQHLKYADLRKKDPAPDIPNPYKSNILKNFTIVSSNDKGRYSRTCPTQMKDKLVAYIIVLALFIDDFRVILDEIHVDLGNVGIPKLKTISEVLGCHVSKKKNGEEMATIAELKIPLHEMIPKYAKKSSSKRF